MTESIGGEWSAVTPGLPDDASSWAIIHSRHQDPLDALEQLAPHEPVVQMLLDQREQIRRARDEARNALIARAAELKVFDTPEERTDDELYWAIKAEENCAAWLARLESLPTDEAKREAVHRMSQQLRGGVS